MLEEQHQNLEHEVEEHLLSKRSGLGGLRTAFDTPFLLKLRVSTMTITMMIICLPPCTTA
eukprot:3087490-Rhodomonas_salina.2